MYCIFPNSRRSHKLACRCPRLARTPTDPGFSIRVSRAETTACDGVSVSRVSPSLLYLAGRLRCGHGLIEGGREGGRGFSAPGSVPSVGVQILLLFYIACRKRSVIGCLSLLCAGNARPSARCRERYASYACPAHTDIPWPSTNYMLFPNSADADSIPSNSYHRLIIRQCQSPSTHPQQQDQSPRTPVSSRPPHPSYFPQHHSSHPSYSRPQPPPSASPVQSPHS